MIIGSSNVETRKAKCIHLYVVGKMIGGYVQAAS